MTSDTDRDTLTARQSTSLGVTSTARAHVVVPQEDTSELGTRVSFPSKFRGTVVVLTGTILHTLYDRNSAQTIVYVQPDYIEEMRSLTTYKMSVPARDITKVQA